ncbi:hypothetical protein FB45DRAFT_1039865 [Roridomyces roridus]|uniref:Uncharacterized protein n=1 Tax=Roridomyces roridus TaxID=1738132 RepID=A0AAD7B2U0_9AGAR|nr:hypothetical protein FB45DRAFT_1039865 [Roridomyces roridus]
MTRTLSIVLPSGIGIAFAYTLPLKLTSLNNTTWEFQLLDAILSFADTPENLRASALHLSFNPGKNFAVETSPDPGSAGLARNTALATTPQLSFRYLGYQGFRMVRFDLRCIFRISAGIANIEVLSPMYPRGTQDISCFHRLQQVRVWLSYSFNEDFWVISTIRPEHRHRHRLRALILDMWTLLETEAKELAHEPCQLQKVFSHRGLRGIWNLNPWRKLRGM